MARPQLVTLLTDVGTRDGYVGAACSPRVKTEEFLKDPRKIAVERASLREQVAWTQPHGEEDTQMLAVDLVRMGVARVSKMQLMGTLDEAVDKTVLVVDDGRQFSVDE